MKKEIHLDAPAVGDLEKEFLSRAIDTGFVSTFGPFVPEFEGIFSDYVGVEKAVSVQSGTAAIYMALYELGIGKDDEVIVPALTFVASVNPVVQVGAIPVFADVDVKTWNISPEVIEKLITDRTKAIMPVHLYGNPCNMDEIMRIANQHHLYVIEDATESLGARYRGRHTGTFGNFGCFSFNGNKIITTGGGGMIVGKDTKRLDHIKFLVNQARDEQKGYYHPELGFNYRMTNIEAALGLAQMERLEEFSKKKRLFNEIYRKELKTVKSIRFQDEYNSASSSYWFVCILCEGDADVSSVQGVLRAKDIPTRRLFMPVTEFPPYLKYRQSEYKNAYQIYNSGLCLPSSTLNSEDDIYYICKIIREMV